MFMMLPFLVGLVGAVFVLAGWRSAAIGTWGILIIILAAWLAYHSTSTLGLDF